MLPAELQAALNTVRRGLHAQKREAFDLIESSLTAYCESLYMLVGPGHVPPESALAKTLPIAKPPIAASYWTEGPWHCLRVEERTTGFNRPRAWFNPVAKRPQLRHDRATEQWMGWMRGIMAHMGIKPLSGSVRVLFCPGLVYTFMAWQQVPERPPHLLHPMDADNAAKPSLDSAQVPKLPKVVKPDEAGKLPEPPTTGAYFNDTQVVDLIVIRLPQTGTPPVDRIALYKERSAARKVAKARRVARLHAPPGAQTPPLDLDMPQEGEDLDLADDLDPA